MLFVPFVFMRSSNGDRLDLDEEFLTEQTRDLPQRARRTVRRIEELIANRAEGRDLTHAD